jgi:DNA-binding IclR family transcriptional regulator
MNTRDPPWDEKSIVKSVFKALSLLEAFSPETPEVTVAELAQRTGIQKATCNRLVMTMMHAGWLMRVGNGRYAPTVKLFRIGSTAIGRLDVREAARPLLHDLANRFGDTSYLLVPDGPRVVCLDRVEGDYPVKVRVFDIGMSLPFHLAAAPLAILAHRDDLLAEIDEEAFASYTEQTVTNLADLQRRLATIRQQGYSISSEDFWRGVAAVGAPVFNDEGVAVAAISVGGLVERFRPPRLDEIIQAVVEAAETLSEQLGHNGMRPPRIASQSRSK